MQRRSALRKNSLSYGDPMDLDQLLEQLVSSQARRDQDLAGYDAADRVLTEAFEQEGQDVVAVKVSQTMAIIRSSERACAEAVAELARFVDERRPG
jgi:hypothetical protein